MVVPTCTSEHNLMSNIHILAARIHGLYFGENWTSVHLQGLLHDIPLSAALHQIGGANTILALAYHLHYYTKAQLDVLRGGTLNANDQRSFAHPEIVQDQEWNAFRETIWAEAREYCERVRQLDEATLDMPFVEERYGTYRSNIAGNIDHAYYHLGQIAMLRRLIRAAGDGLSVQ